MNHSTVPPLPGGDQHQVRLGYIPQGKEIGSRIILQMILGRSPGYVSAMGHDLEDAGQSQLGAWQQPQPGPLFQEGQGEQDGQGGPQVVDQGDFQHLLPALGQAHREVDGGGVL